MSSISEFDARWREYLTAAEQRTPSHPRAALWRDFVSARHKTYSGDLPSRTALFALEMSVIRDCLNELSDRSGSYWTDGLRGLLPYFDSRAVFRTVSESFHEHLPDLIFEPVPPVSGPIRKVAVICAVLRTGGAERCAALWMEYLVRRGCEVLLISAEPPSARDYAYPAAVRRIVLERDPRVERMFRLEDTLRDFAPDLCITIDHCFAWTLTDLLTARQLGIRTLAQEHNIYTYPLYSGMPELFFARAAVYRACDAVTCLSRADRMQWRLCGVNSWYQPNPLTFDPASVRPADPDSRTLLFAGKLSGLKGAHRALEVLELVLRMHPDAALLLAGTFPDAESERVLRAYVSEHHLTEHVTFAGFQKDIAECYRKSAVLLMPSAVEGYPMTLMEAKAHAVPTVCFAMPYLEAAQPDMGVIQVGKNDVSGMADAVCALLADSARRKQLAAAARQSLDLFSQARVEARWEQLLDALSSGSVPEDAPDADTAALFSVVLPEYWYGLAACLDQEDFIERNRVVIVKRYLAKSEILLAAAKLDFIMRELLPEGSFRRKCARCVFRIPAAVSGFCFRMLRKGYRFLKPWHENPEQDY